MSEPENDDPAEAPKPSAQLQNLASIAARAGAAKAHKDRRYGTSFGAANQGKRLTSWICACGWTGAATELKGTAAGLACPSCGVAGRVRSV